MEPKTEGRETEVTAAEPSAEGSRRMARAPDSDAELVARFVSGEAEAFDRLFLKYQEYVYNICLGILGHPDDARDCTQETFMQVYRAARSFRGQAQFSTWIYRIAVNNCRGLLRKRPKAPPASLEDAEVGEMADPGPPPWREAERRAVGEEVRAIVAGLPPDYRTVLVLRYFQEQSYEQMVEILGWSLPQVKVKLHRARRAFARVYAQREGAGEARR
jgi:RNA polymerase sigma-70 factor (ECF subfamily)